MPATKVDVLIVLSGLLVLVSIVLLALGLRDEDSLTLVYFSIGTSIVAGILLVLGALQRRGETPAAADASGAGAGDTTERVTTVSVTRPTVTTPSGSVEETAAMPVASSGSGPTVSVVPGRPRYHVAGCRFLAGRDDVTQMALDAAKDENFTACGVCKPDDALAADAGDPTVLDAPAADPEVDTLLETPTERARTRAASAGSTSGRAAKSTAASGTRAPAKTATKAAGRTAGGKATPAKAAAKAPAKAAAKATVAKATPAKAAPAKATAAKAAPAKATGTTVVVIPDRDKFHTDGCRFVRGVAGTVSVAKATARRQGYEPCGVCKP